MARILYLQLNKLNQGWVWFWLFFVDFFFFFFFGRGVLRWDGGWLCSFACCFFAAVRFLCVYLFVSFHYVTVFNGQVQPFYNNMDEDFSSARKFLLSTLYQSKYITHFRYLYVNLKKKTRVMFQHFK